MESALPLRHDQKRQAFLLAILATGAFLFGFFFEGVSVKSIFFIIFAAVAVGILVVPYQWAIRILFAYLGFEGMAKILTGYNPVVHVGADLLVLALTGRWLLALLLQRAAVPRELPPLKPLFALHLTWFFIQFFNPYALGIVPSLAGVKVYVTMLLLYVFGFYLAKDRKSVEWFMAIWVLTVVIQVATGLFQAWQGPASVLAISPGYAGPLSKFDGYAFRPFGTTHLPGGPSVLIFLGAPFFMYFLVSCRSWLTKAFLASVLPLATLLLLLCQIRASLMKAIVGSALFLFIVAWHSSAQARRRFLVAIPVAAALLAFALPTLTQKWAGERADNTRAIARSLSLFDYDTAIAARRGAAERIGIFAEMVPLGAGLSRTGAAGGKFADRAAKDPHFPLGFFSDNFWAATIAELGIPGSAILTMLIFAILGRGALAIRRTRIPQVQALQAALLCPLLAIVVGLWGAEGLLYNPEAAFFWFFSGVLMRLSSLDRLPFEGVET
ncbi:MAG: hypothetical protein NDJ90_07550 [Oligoflexia bacterium]|nr:hypothetical protein [Oligoflexia bacterium]